MLPPKLHLTNWSRVSHDKAPKKVYTLMTRPRTWEHGDGQVEALTPDPGDFGAAKGKDLSWPEFERRCIVRFSGHDLRPGHLQAVTDQGPVLVEDGDTLCCSCAAGAPCHRQFAAPLLLSAGWDVWLDQVRWTGPQPTLFG